MKKHQINKNIDIYLYDELQVSAKLIGFGFCEFQNLNFGNDFYFLPFQLISSGFERMMKCHICLGYHEKNNTYPDKQYLKSCGGESGHDLTELRNTILLKYFAINNNPILQEDYELLTNDKDLDQLIDLLSEFGKYARYHNLDIVTSASKPSKNVKQLWQDYEVNLLQSTPKVLQELDNFESCEKNFDYIKQQILIKLERFTRAICRQFTIGQLGKKALQYSGVFYDFIIINDNNLGNQNYREFIKCNGERISD